MIKLLMVRYIKFCLFVCYKGLIIIDYTFSTIQVIKEQDTSTSHIVCIDDKGNA